MSTIFTSQKDFSLPFFPMINMAVDAENTCFDNMGFADIQQEQDHLHLLHSYYDFALPSSSSSSSFPVDTLQSFSCQFEKQIDWFVHLQSKRLRNLMVEYESRMKALMVEKDGELAMARSKTTNLEDLLMAAEMEARGWEKVAREREAVVCDVNSRLRERDDAASFCGRGERKMVCKLCECERACVVLWPCRHLCCCKQCEPFLKHCPLCRTIKDSTFEAFLA